MEDISYKRRVYDSVDDRRQFLGNDSKIDGKNNFKGQKGLNLGNETLFLE